MDTLKVLFFPSQVVKLAPLVPSNPAPAFHMFAPSPASMLQPGEDILNWGEFDLHLLVACFLRVRFPIVVALNKADTSEAAEHIARVQAGDEGFSSAC